MENATVIYAATTPEIEQDIISGLMPDLREMVLKQHRFFDECEALYHSGALNDIALLNRYAKTFVDGTRAKDYKWLTAWTFASGWRQWYDYGDDKTLNEIYVAVYMGATEHAYSHLKGKQLEYFYRTID